MKNLIFMSLAIPIWLNACEYNEYRKGPQPEITTFKSVNDPTILKQKIIEELGLLDISEIIADLDALQSSTKNLAKNLP